jgi:hypothetical protein
MESFVFESYSIDPSGTEISFRYSEGKNTYTERIILGGRTTSEVGKAVLDSILFNLHLALGISYWKANCSKKIEIKSGSLTEDQAVFWETVYTKGLGEFYFRNNIDFRELVHFPFSNTSSAQLNAIPPSEKQLVGIGGGKDSVVAWELLKAQNKDITGLLIKTQHAYQAVDELVEKMKMPTISVERLIDSVFITNTKNHTYNGHVPISMIYAWIGILVCYLNGFGSFVVANEKSADQGNTELFGMQVNHQWSKTKEFEDLFASYLHTFITPQLNYYSPIRKLTELEVVGECIKHSEYLPYITSCNRNFSITKKLQGKKWCGECPKCASAFLMFAAHLPKKEVTAMFGKDMLADASLMTLFKDLLGHGGIKPFECVATFEESQEALKWIKEKGEYNGLLE